MRKVVLFVIAVLYTGALFAQDNTEFRATWVITWNIYGGSQPAETIKARIRKILDDHQQANMNAVVWQVRQGGTSYYRSNFEPWGEYLGSSDPGFDPLEYAIEEAHNRGMELHAWFNTFHCSSTAAGAPAAAHPEWVCRNSSGQPMTASRALSPGLPAVRAYTVSVAMDIVRRYDIDGLHLDYVRWNEESGAVALSKEPDRPELDGLISEAEIAELNASMASRYLYDVDHPYSGGVPAGFGSWEEWWRFSVTEFVRTLHDSVQAAKPWVRLSAAALGNYNWGGWQGYGSVYQDAALWFNAGYVDQLMPMHYHWDSGAGFYGMLTGSNSSWEPWIRQGLTAGRLYSVGPGSYILSEGKVMDRHAGIVDYCRLVPWVDGFQFFSYGTWEQNQFFKEAGATFFPNKTKVRAAKFLADATPAAPTVSVTRIDSLTYEVTVTPPSTEAARRMAIYRTDQNSQHPDSDPILQILRGETAATFIDRFDGLQDHAGSFYYYATTLDHYWNESQPSATVEAGPVPSFAPVITAFSPQNGDTVNVNASLMLTFSKGMDSGSVEAALTFTPNVAVKLYNWSDDKKAVEVVLAAPMQFGTTYAVQLSESARDLNNKSLDGDGDGLAGGNFGFSFITVNQDIAPPVVVAIFPDAGAAELLPVEGLINILFDEHIAPASIAESTIVLTQNGIPVQDFWLHVPADNRSLLTIQPLKPFEINANCHVEIKPVISDTAGNVISRGINLDFTTRAERTLKEVVIDKFFGVAAWKDPSYSGSTVGTLAAKTLFEISRAVYLPNSYGTQKYAAALRYQWDPMANEHLCRVYLDPAMAPGQVFFDTTYTLQMMVFGDGSGSLLRLAIDEVAAKNTLPEVTTWVKVDWYGWRLVEWDLGDPKSIGSWLATNGILEGNKLSIDSIQLTRSSGSALGGALYFDNLVVVTKTSNPTAVDRRENKMPGQFTLEQNYPNPFNPVTRIVYELPAAGRVHLAVYDLLGREVARLADGEMAAGIHSAVVDARSWSSGIYYYRLTHGEQTLSRKMMVIK